MHKKPLRFLILGAGWIVLIVAGFSMLTNYENSPGKKGETSVIWPSKSKIARVLERPTLLMFAHPKCPCTKASINEFTEIVGRADQKLDVHIIFFKPQDASDDWNKTDLWKSAIALPGVTVHVDAGNVEAGIFGIETSGHTLLYHADGKLLFTGGITDGRGKAGESQGARMIMALLNDSSTVSTSTAVFGCSLLNAEALSAAPLKNP